MNSEAEKLEQLQSFIEASDWGAAEQCGYECLQLACSNALGTLQGKVSATADTGVDEAAKKLQASCTKLSANNASFAPAGFNVGEFLNLVAIVVEWFQKRKNG